MKDDVERIIYYDDPLTDEFSKAKITPKRIDGNYKYIRGGFFGRLAHFFWYRAIAFPLAKAYLKIKFGQKILNKKLLKPYKKDGYFIYGNHTQDVADALIPSFVCRPKNVYVIVHPNNVSMPYLGKITPYLGAIPLPDDAAATKNFLSAVKTRLIEKCAICIYPEAHIWPYYTDIRPFTDASFRYPVKYKKPAFCFTNTYVKKKAGGKVKIITYVDGPFFANENLSAEEQRKEMRDKIYSAMKERSKNSNAEIIKYVRRPAK